MTKRPQARSISAQAYRGAQFVTISIRHKKFLSTFYRIKGNKSTIYTKNIGNFCKSGQELRGMHRWEEKNGSVGAKALDKKLMIG